MSNLNKSMKFIALDCETGGIKPQADLLTTYFGVHDENLELIDELTIRLRPDSENDFFSVSAKSLEINKINLVEHFKIADTKSVAGKKLFEFLKKHSENGAIKLIPIGHNVTFDVQKVTDNLLGKKTWDHFVGYRKLDTGVLGQFFQITGHIDPNISASLGNLLAFYGLEFQGEAHTERADALACVDIIKEMVKQFKKELK